MSDRGNTEVQQKFFAEIYGDLDEEDLVKVEVDEILEVEEESEEEEDEQVDEIVEVDVGVKREWGGEEEEDEQNEATSPTPPTYRTQSPLHRLPASHNRLYPLKTAKGFVLRFFDADGVKLTPSPRPHGEGAVGMEVNFLNPDAHAQYVRMNERVKGGALDDRSEEEMCARSVRGRARGGRGGRERGQGGRGRGIGGGRGRRVADPWVVGHPLEEIWVTDDDVPLELRDMAMDAVRRRMRTTTSTTDISTLKRKRMDEEDASESENDDFDDAIDGSPNSRFEWSPMETFQLRESIFTPQKTGAVDSFSSPYDAFRSYWDESILHMIAEKTNQYAAKIDSRSFQAEWYPTNFHEILCLFAFWMMLGIVRMPTIESCFSTHYLLSTEVFRRIFTLKRYKNLARALHFIHSDPSNNAASTSINDMASSDPIYLLRPIIDHINAKFQANYILSQDICIDESLTLWKGRCNIKEYVRSKAAKLGIKTFELCESATGYLWSLIVYNGKENDATLPNSRVLKSTTAVKKLMAPLLNKGYRLFVDNWYNSPDLARFLKRNGTDCVVTLRYSCKDIPIIMKKAPLKQGQFMARHAGDVCLLTWQDKKRVNMISTCHGAAIGWPTVPSRLTTRPPPFKPQMVLDYNRSMGGVDLKDQMLEPYLLERKRCAKWYMKLFKRLLNVSILNARILLQSSQNKKADHLEFRLQLVDSILSKHLPHCPNSRTPFASHSSHHSSISATHHVNHTHWPVSIPPNGSRASTNRKGRLACVLCYSQTRQTKTTAFKCEECNVPLCVEPCFRTYHTK